MSGIKGRTGVYERTEEHRRKLSESKKGRPRSEETKQKISKGLFKGDSALKRTGNHRAYFLYRELNKCELCDKIAVHRHHKDGNPLNNETFNIQFLCARCHMIIDGRFERQKRDWHGRIVGYQK